MRFRSKWIFVICIAAVAVGEIGLKTQGFGSPLLYHRSSSGFEVLPGQTVMRLGKVTTYNSFGTRNDEVPVSASNGLRRLMILGDSIANGGTQVSNAETIAGRLQELAPGIEALNASAGGWSLINEDRWLKEHGLLGSSLLLLEVGENDLFQPFVDGSILDVNPSFPTRKPLTATGEVVFRYLLPRLGFVNAQDPGASSAGSSASLANDAFAAAQSIVAQALNENAKIAILYMDPAEPSQSPDVVAARERLLAWAGRENISVIRPGLDKVQANGIRVFRDHLHPNEMGNIVVARAIIAALNHLE